MNAVKPNAVDNLVLGFVPQTPDAYGGKAVIRAGSPTYKYYKCSSGLDIMYPVTEAGNEENKK
ncbi:hypothetical protein [Brasilonema bromeliae]|uniref:hypothetical protein n=1 Tax=Brasilonema bromeliae TaxID=383615 RepID=UPI00145D2B46|nr:hypothetical protein [Brasilonema bromeliae]